MFRDQLDLAERLVTDRGVGPRGTWPRVSAFLTRRVMEAALAELWKKRLPGVENANFRSQLICLPLVLDDKDLIADTRAAWYSLSRACHHHQYELAPIAGELATWISQADRLLKELDDELTRDPEQEDQRKATGG